MSKNESNSGIVAVGAAALAAAAAGAYYFYGSDAATKHRRSMKGWMVKAKGEVMEQLENLTDVTQANYETAVAAVLNKYKQAKNIDPQELVALTGELQQAWKKISAHLKTGAKPKAKAKKPATKKK